MTRDPGSLPIAARRWFFWLIVIPLYLAAMAGLLIWVTGTSARATECVPSDASVQRYSWTGGPHEGDDPPAFPSDDWQPNVAGDPQHIGQAGAYFQSHGGYGKGDWFYLEYKEAITCPSLTPTPTSSETSATPAPEPTITSTPTPTLEPLTSPVPTSTPTPAPSETVVVSVPTSQPSSTPGPSSQVTTPTSEVADVATPELAATGDASGILFAVAVVVTLAGAGMYLAKRARRG